MLLDVEKKVDKWQEPPPVKQVKALPAPIDPPAKYVLKFFVYPHFLPRICVCLGSRHVMLHQSSSVTWNFSDFIDFFSLNLKLVVPPTVARLTLIKPVGRH